MNSKQAYRKFLQSDFWKTLSAEKRRLFPKCKECGSKKCLQSHHMRYPSNWFDTTLDDLIVLCRFCHAKEHGIIVIHRYSPFFPYREDDRFNAFVHRCHCLCNMVIRGKPLRDRDKRFLAHAARCYPGTKKDAAMEFQVRNTMKLNALMLRDYHGQIHTDLEQDR